MSALEVTRAETRCDDGFVDELAGHLGGVDRQALGDATGLVDHTTLPADADLATAYRAFESATRLAV